MAVAPNTSIYFCNVPWDSDYRYVCDGATAEYIASLALTTSSAYTYQRKDNIIKASIPIDDLIGANYVMYRNTNHENKWFYAFILDIEYVSETRTNVTIKTDVYQTWRAAMTIKNSFVIREHVTDDSTVWYTVPENLETGPYKNTDMTNVGLRITKLLFACTCRYPGFSEVDIGGVYNGIFAGCVYYSFTPSDWNGILSFINAFTLAGKREAILAIFLMPSIIIGGATGLISQQTYACISLTHTPPARPATIDGYAPKNNKLFTHPFTYLYGQNNMGSAGIFKYEEYPNGAPVMQVVGNIGTNAQVKVFPNNKISNDAVDPMYQYSDEAITIGGWPMLLWSWDKFDSYNATQSGQITAGFAGSALSLGLGVATGNPAAIAIGIVGAFSSVAGYMDQSRQPPQASGGASSGTANLTAGLQDIYFYSKTIKAEYAAIIDEFFSMYGYKINRTKTPALTGRAQWNYIQTNDIIITGAIPQDDKKQLSSIFDKGVTIWHVPGNIGNYALANGVT